MGATYTFDIFCTFDGYSSYGPAGDWGGYWGKQGPQLLKRRLASFDSEQRMVFGATTFRLFVEMLANSTENSDVRDAWVTRTDEEDRHCCNRSSAPRLRASTLLRTLHRPRAYQSRRSVWTDALQRKIGDIIAERHEHLSSRS